MRVYVITRTATAMAAWSLVRAFTSWRAQKKSGLKNKQNGKKEKQETTKHFRERMIYFYRRQEQS